MDMKSMLEELCRHRAEALEMGGTERIKRQHERGKLTARERINLLMDPGTFQEYGLLASHQGQRPGEKVTPADAVVTGFGRIDGRRAGIIAEDFTVLGGSVGNVNLQKRVRMVEIATQERVPLVWLVDGAGARAQQMAVGAEGIPIVSQFVKIAKMSGIVPQVGVVLGGCAGESSLEVSLLEFIIMVKGTGMLAAGGPPVVLTSTSQQVSKEELGGVKVHCAISGVADNPADDDEDALLMTKRYLSYLPSNAWEYPPYIKPEDDPERKDEELIEILPDNLRRPYNMKRIINCIVDRGSFFEMKPLFATMMITGLARMNGHTVGIIANQPMVSAGAITAKAAQKERHFIDLCSAYHIPLLFLVDCPGVMTGPDSEKEGALRFGLSVAYALSWADVPKITLVIHKSFGFGGAAMCGYDAKQTLTLAWPTADFASLPMDAGIQAAHAAELAASDNPAALRKQLEETYKKYSGPYPAAAIYNVDEIIDPRETRPRIIRALDLALNRRSAPPRRQSGTG